MIQSFKSKPLKLFFEKGDNSKIRPDMADKILEILTMLHAAVIVRDMNAPSLNLHKLRGDREGYWSVTVKENWRITFIFDRPHAFKVNLEDYH